MVVNWFEIRQKINKNQKLIFSCLQAGFVWCFIQALLSEFNYFKFPILELKCVHQFAWHCSMITWRKCHEGRWYFKRIKSSRMCLGHSALSIIERCLDFIIFVVPFYNLWCHLYLGSKSNCSRKEKSDHPLKSIWNYFFK